MTEIIRNENILIFLIENEYTSAKTICYILRKRKCAITPRLMAALAKTPWYRQAIEAICLRGLP